MLIEARSVVGRLLNGSWWPTILGCDVAATSGVKGRVIFLSAFGTFGIVMMAIVAVLTPLGLYNTVSQVSSADVHFVYASDTSPIGQSTLDRDSYNTSRMCGYWAWLSCPGQNHGFFVYSNSSGAYLDQADANSYISSIVPSNLTGIFSSGRQGNMSTVAGPFDIEYRSYRVVHETAARTSVLVNDTGPPDPKIDNYAARTAGAIGYAEMILLADDFVIRDGIIADMRSGGLGFRNHTVPKNAYAGANWTESLLWLEPETVCVPNNITIEFNMAEDGLSINDRTALVDYGGIVNRETKYPHIDMNNTQLNPQLYARAHKAALINNYNLGQQLGVYTSNGSRIGDRYTIQNGYQLAPGLIAMDDFDSGLPGISLFPFDPSVNASLVDQELIGTTE